MKKSFVIMIALSCLVGCNKGELDWESVQVTDIQIAPAAITAEVTATFVYAEKHELFFEYSDYEDMMYAHRYPMIDEGDGHYHTTVYNLEGQSQYYYRFMARSKFGTKETEISKFTTVELFAPTITTKPVSKITVFSCSTGGDISFDGGAPVKKRGVCWSPNPNPTLNDSVVLYEQDHADFKVNIVGLQPETTYYVRAFATNKAGTSYGQEESFTTSTIGLPQVITKNVDYVSRTWATCVGEVTDNGGLSLIERGICWSEHPTPTLDDNTYHIGFGVGIYTIVMPNLLPNTTYYVRAYAINAFGMSYGEVLDFTTFSFPDNTAEGGLNGVFSINSRNHVWFSKGNLRYMDTLPEWRFAEQQYDYVGIINDNIATTRYWIDLFGWATSGYKAIETTYCYLPTSYSSTAEYLHGGSWGICFENELEQCDWGVHNSIANGGNTPGLWRTLSASEWNYLFYVRTTLEGIRFAKAQVNTVKGIILLPDFWSNETFPLNNPNQGNASFNSNVISTAEWTVLEDAGAVFLPAAGQRRGITTGEINVIGHYWSANADDQSEKIYELLFTASRVEPQSMSDSFLGHSVRLVMDIPPQ